MPNNEPESVAHMANIRAVLVALQGTEVAMALLACEDAYVALQFGLSLGLSMEAILRNCAVVHDKAGGC